MQCHAEKILISAELEGKCTLNKGSGVVYKTKLGTMKLQGVSIGVLSY